MDGDKFDEDGEPSELLKSRAKSALEKIEKHYPSTHTVNHCSMLLKNIRSLLLLVKPVLEKLHRYPNIFTRLDTQSVERGLRIFLKHMLFMGSTKFPDENEYDSYLSKHGGSSNAYTEAEHTFYHFEVKPEFLKGALRRFSQLFVSPLVKIEAMERERPREHLYKEESDTANLCHCLAGKEFLEITSKPNGILSSRVNLVSFFH
ncbi:hypothetical protein ACFXTH_006149 [Malus domestica]